MFLLTYLATVVHKDGGFENFLRERKPEQLPSVILTALDKIVLVFGI